MTLKQIDAEIKRIQRSLEESKRDDAEMMELRGFSCYGKDIDYYSNRLQTLKCQRPKIEQEEEEKRLKKIAKQQLKDKAGTIGYIKKGNDIYGVTPSGKKWSAIHNWYGMTERTLHCYTLYIDRNHVFTSGTLDTVLHTVACN